MRFFPLDDDSPQTSRRKPIGNAWPEKSFRLIAPIKLFKRCELANAIQLAILPCCRPTVNESSTSHRQVWTGLWLSKD